MGVFLEETENFLRLLILARKAGNERIFCINYLDSKESHDGVLYALYHEGIFDDLTSGNDTIPADIYRFLWGGSNKDVDGRVDLVETSITSLQQNVAALDVPALTALAGTVTANTNAIEGKADSSTVTTLAGRVTTAQTDLSTLQTTVAGKADSSTVTTLAGRVTTAEGEIDQLQIDVAGKADQSSVTANANNIAANTASINALGAQLYHMSFNACLANHKIVDNTKMDEAFFDDIDALVSSTSTGGKSGKGGGSSENIEETCMAYLLCYINQLEGRDSYLADDSQYTCPTFDTTCDGLTSVSNVCSMSNSPFDNLCGVSSPWLVEKIAAELCTGIS